MKFRMEKDYQIGLYTKRAAQWKADRRCEAFD